MIRGAFLHLPGIGPVREARLRQSGARDWGDLGPSPPPGLHLGPATWRLALDQVSRCAEAYERRDIGFFTRCLCGPDRWRLLASYGERAAFLDIETEGLHYGARITVIACAWRGRLYTFVQGESLDEFLDLLPGIELLITFNGTSFDVPMILHGFHIPELPCPHLDLRWVCYHAGCRGGLKSVEASLGVPRPADLQGVDGAEAVALWERWQHEHERAARNRLVRYCAADALALRAVSAALLARCGVTGNLAVDPATLWADLDEVAPAPAPEIGPASGTGEGTPTVGIPASPPLAPAMVPAPLAAPPAPPARPGVSSAAPGDDTRRRLRELLRRRFVRGG